MHVVWTGPCGLPAGSAAVLSRGPQGGPSGRSWLPLCAADRIVPLALPWPPDALFVRCSPGNRRGSRRPAGSGHTDRLRAGCVSPVPVAAGSLAGSSSPQQCSGVRRESRGALWARVLHQWWVWTPGAEGGRPCDPCPRGPRACPVWTSSEFRGPAGPGISWVSCRGPGPGPLPDPSSRAPGRGKRRTLWT